MENVELPKGFVDLNTAYTTNPTSQQFCNIIGVVVDLMSPKQLNNRQYVFTFKLLDPSLSYLPNGSNGLLIRFFKPDIESLPKIRNLGDVVLLRQIKMIQYQGQPVGLANFSTGFLVFEGSAIPDPSFIISILGHRNKLECHGVPLEVNKLSLQEQAYAVKVKADMKSTVEELSGKEAVRHERDAVAPPPAKRLKSSGTFGYKFSLVKDLEPMRFADICGQVVKRFGAQHGCDLYITDYTENDQLFYYSAPEDGDTYDRDGDTFGYAGPSKKSWPGPYGFLVLHLNVKAPHANFVMTSVNEGDFVLARNVKMRITNAGARLEGDMWPDDRNPEMVQVKKMLNPELPEITALLQRKEKYWAGRKPVQMPEQEETRKLSKAERNKLKKQKRKERADATTRKTGSDVDLNDHDIGESTNSRNGINPHVRCSHEEVSVTQLKDILDPDDKTHTNNLPSGQTYILPFINARYRAKVRVVDFAPKDMADFAVPADTSDELSSDPMDWQSDSTPKYEWYFALQIEDATKANDIQEPDRARMWLHVQHEEAQFLLGRVMDDPEDLRTSKKLLAQLKERMFVLWGNLEEKAESDELSNLPFECCIKEYGVEVDEDDSDEVSVTMRWKRMHALFGTTIT